MSLRNEARIAPGRQECTALRQGQVRREVERRGISQLGSAVAACALIAFALLFHCWVRTRVTEEGYRLSRISAERQRLLRERDRLTLQAAQLLRPARIEELARRLGMGPPRPAHVVVLLSPQGASAREAHPEPLALRVGSFPRAGE